MADEDVVKQLQEAYERLKKLAESGATMTQLKDQLHSFGDLLKNSGTSAAEAARNIANLAGNSDELHKKVRELVGGITDMTQWVDELAQKFGMSGEDLAKFSVQMVSLTGMFTKHLPVPEAFSKIGENAKSSTQSMQELLDTSLKFIGMPEGNFSTFLKGVTQRGDFAKQFEAGFLTAASASGEFTEVLETLGNDLSGLSLKTDVSSKLFQTIGNSAGVSSTKVAEYAASLRTIPGALDNFHDSAGLVVENMHFLDAAMKIASGTGQTFDQVLTQMQTMFDNLGLKGKPALEVIARMQNVSDAANIPLAQMREYTNRATESFKFLGENAEGAISVMAELGPALQRSGLGPNAIRDLVQGVTSGISEMKTAQKSFLSAQTGGPGGLQGAFQIDLMLRQGKLDEVFQKVQQNLKQQFGGTIVSLEEAAKDAGAAAQFQRQIALVKSPALGGIAKSDAEAMRVLEAISAKDRGIGPSREIKSPADAFKDAVSTGDKIRDRGNTILTKINNLAERSAQIQSIIAYNTTRMAVGYEGPLANYLQGQMREDMAEASKLKPLTGQGGAGGRSVDQILTDAAQTVSGALSDLPDTVKSMFDIAPTPAPTAMPGETPKVLGMNLREPVSPAQAATRTMEAAERIQAGPGRINPGAPGIGPDGRVRANNGMKVDVAVTTASCSVCQGKIAAQAAESAIRHYHEANNQANRTPVVNTF